MYDLNNWRISVDECHTKHIGPPPPLHRRIRYAEAHRWTARTGGRFWVALGILMRGIWRNIRKK